MNSTRQKNSLLVNFLYHDHVPKKQKQEIESMRLMHAGIAHYSLDILSDLLMHYLLYQYNVAIKIQNTVVIL